MSEIKTTDIYTILKTWAQLNPSAQTGDLDAVLHAQSRAFAQDLLTQTSVQFRLPDQGIDHVLQRSAVEAWHELHKDPPRFQEAPERCPACQGLLLGKWQCELCGLELSRWEIPWKGGSLDAQTYLPWGYALLPDPRRQRLIILKLLPQAHVVWQINLDRSICEEPVSVRLLPQQEVLVADRKGKVFSCDLFGQIRWQCKHPLKEPVYAAGTQDGNILIADRQLHQVLLINRTNDILWSYGHAGKAGDEDGYLRNPHAFSLTRDGSFLVADTGNRRILEISDLSRKIRRTIGEHAALQEPIWCERLPNGHTQILDAGSYRILDFDATLALNDNCLYFQSHLDMRYRLQAPIGIQRLENGHWLLSNAERIVEINPSQKRLLWFSLLTDLRPPSMFQAKRPETTQLSSRTENTVKSTFRVQDALQQISVFEDAPEAFFEKIKLCLRYEEHPAGHLLIREGQRGDAMYLIRDGEVEILKEFQVITTLSQGDVFGEMALLNGETRNATVRVKTQCRLYKLNRLAFETVIQAFPEVHQRIRVLSQARQQHTPLTEPLPARERLSQLMAESRKRLEEIRTRRAEPIHHQVIQGPLHWKLRYTALEQHLIQEARIQNYHCYELHIRLDSQCQMKSVRVSLLVMTLEKLGDIIKTYPNPEDILQEKLDHEVILSILTRSSRSRLLEDVSSVAEIEDAKAIPVQF